MKTYFKPIASRLAGSVVSLVCGVLFARLVIAQFGFETYAVISVLASLPALLPFADLGLGASLVNGSSDLHRDSGDHRARGTITAAARMIAVSGAAIATVGVIVAGLGAWPTILGVGDQVPDVNLTGAITLALVGVSVILSVSGRMLQGSGNISLVYLLTAGGPAVGLGAAALVLALMPPTALVGAAPMIGAVAASALCAIPAIRRYPGRLLADLLTLRPTKGLAREIFSTASSSLIVTLGTVVAFQADRVILSHLSTPQQVGEYSLVAPLYIAGYGLLNAVGQSLWPLYRKLVANRQMSVKLLNKDVVRLGSLGLLGGLLIISLGPMIVGLMTGKSDIVVPVDLFVTFGVLATVQAIHLPSAMLLTDTRGWKFQRNIVVVMALTKVLLSVFLAPLMGAVGVVMATTIAIVVIQAPLTYLQARRSSESREAD